MCALLCVYSSFAIILGRNRRLVALLLLSYICFVTMGFLWLFIMVPWVCLQCVIVVFPDHSHLLFVFWLCCRIYHTVILDDPYDDPSGLEVPDRSPEPTKEQLDVSDQITS